LIAGESVQTTMLVATLLVLFALGLGLYGCVAIVQRWLPYGRF
jgi:ABC-type nitrate/sulfonate/bicarbonate transport system permease component